MHYAWVKIEVLEQSLTTDIFQKMFLFLHIETCILGQSTGSAQLLKKYPQRGLARSEEVVHIQFLQGKLVSNTKIELLLLPFQWLPQWCLPFFSGAGAEKDGELYHSNEDTSAVCLRTFYKRFLLLIDLSFFKFTGVFLIALLRRVLSQTELQRTNGSRASKESLLSKLVWFYSLEKVLLFYQGFYCLKQNWLKKKGKENPIIMSFKSRKKNIYFWRSQGFSFIHRPQEKSAFFLMHVANLPTESWSLGLSSFIFLLYCLTLFLTLLPHYWESTAQTPTSTKPGTQFCSSSSSIPPHRLYNDLNPSIVTTWIENIFS